MKNIKSTPQRIVRCIFLSLFILHILCSCAEKRVYSTSMENQVGTQGESVLEKVEFHRDLKNKLHVAGMNHSKVLGDFLKIQLRLENQMNKELNLIYKIEWLDKDGLIISDSSLVWLPLLIRGGETVGVQSVATSKTAQNFNFKVQLAKKS